MHWRKWGTLCICDFGSWHQILWCNMHDLRSNMFPGDFFPQWNTKTNHCSCCWWKYFPFQPFPQSVFVVICAGLTGVSCCVCHVVLAGVPELSRVVPWAPQTGHGGEQPSTEAYTGPGDHAGRAEPILGWFIGSLLTSWHRAEWHPCTYRLNCQSPHSCHSVFYR